MTSDTPDGTGAKTPKMAKTPKTLSDDKIVTIPRVRRRRLLSLVGGALVGAAAVATGFVPSRSHALTDNDSGRSADPVRGGRGSGITDNDSGRYADSVGGGRGTGVTDNDSGRNSDLAGAGRGRFTGLTDVDSGRYADAGGGGRGSDAADNDVGRFADPVDRD